MSLIGSDAISSAAVDPREAASPTPTGGDGPVIRLRLFGAVRLTGTPSADAVLSQPRRTAVLAHLGLAQRAGFVRRDVLAGLFWPEHRAAHARTALRKVVHGLREALGESSIEGRGDEELRLAPSVVWCDVTHFRLAVAEGDFERALALYDGPLLEGFYADAPEFERLVESERRAFAEAAAAAAWQAAAGHEQNSEPTLATRRARQAARMGGADERLLRKALALLERQGDVAGALALYADFARQLRAEFQADPSEETRQLVQRMKG